MNFKMMTLAGVVGALALTAGAAQAVTTYDADLVVPGVYFGSGNPNGHFTVETVDGIELGLRARPNPLAPVAPQGGNTNIYNIALGQNVSFDFSFNPGAFSTAGLASLIRITNVGTGATASFSPLILPDNASVGGGFQNSEQLGFGFLNGGFGGIFGNLGYSNAVDSTYRIDFSASGANFTQVSDSIVVNQGAGAVPEPASWALMILGFGAAGATLRRRKALAHA